jgi:hypothetical protein
MIVPVGTTSVKSDASPQLGGILDSNGHLICESKGADVASANALVLGTDGNYFDITGAVAITSIGTLKIGTVVTLHFDGALTLTHHGTNLILPGGANITTAAGDEAIFVEYDTGVWRCIAYTKASGVAVTPLELASSSEINTGTDATKANTPDALAGSIFGTKNVVVKVIADDTDLTVADGLTHFTVPAELNGMNLVSVGAHVYTVSSGGLPTFQIHNLTDAVDMLSTAITIDATENDSKDAATPPVINTGADDVSTGDVIRFDCDGIGTGTKGMEIRMGFRLP